MRRLIRYPENGKRLRRHITKHAALMGNRPDAETCGGYIVRELVPKRNVYDVACCYEAIIQYRMDTLSLSAAIEALPEGIHWSNTLMQDRG